MKFISDTNLKMHKEYVRQNRLRLSIFEKSYPELSGKDCSEILNVRIRKNEKQEAFELSAEIKAHEIYFSSFGSSCGVCAPIKKEYGSEAAFLYCLYEKCIDREGFLYLYHDRNNQIRFFVGKDYKRVLINFKPILAVDLFEHAYFFDYGFDREGYIKSALSSLNLSKLSENIKKD